MVVKMDEESISYLAVIVRVTFSFPQRSLLSLHDA
jgi:hypothetical protein